MGSMWVAGVQCCSLAFFGVKWGSMGSLWFAEVL